MFENLKSFAIMIAVFGTIIYLVSKPWYDARAIRENFQGKISSFIDLDLDEYLEGKGFRTGKVLIINYNDKKLDDAHMKLPNDMKAFFPYDVATIVWVNRKPTSDDIDESRLAGKGNAHVWLLTVIDFKDETIVGEKVLRGSAPLSMTYGEGDSSDFEPSDYEVVDFVKSLTHRN